MRGGKGAITELAAERQDLLDRLNRASGGRIAGFKPGQWEAVVDAILPGGRLLLVQGTGWGKSLVYFAATMILRGRGAGASLVISPLVSLMRDQVRQATALGLSAGAIHHENEDDWPDILARLDGGALDLLLISPERLGARRFHESHLLSVLSRTGLLVVDEAHCLSDWGHDFRPDYRRFRRLLTRPLAADASVLATTATADARVIDDLSAELGPGLRVMRGPLDRPSLAFGVLDLPAKADRYAWLTERLGNLPGSGIVYVATRRESESLADWLAGRGLAVAAYHAGLVGAGERERREEALQANRVRALIATSALGMGFDKPDLGFVVHLQAPPSPIHYYQQAGRAGRGLERALALLMGGPEDEDIHRWRRVASMPDETELRAVLDAVEDAEGEGVSAVAIAGLTGMAAERVDVCLRRLASEADPAVERHGGLWRGLCRPVEFDARAVAARDKRRQREWARMRDYRASRDCRMVFLARELGDEGARPCGRCDVCLGRALVPAGASRSLARQAQDHLAARGLADGLAPDASPVWAVLKAVFGKG